MIQEYKELDRLISGRPTLDLWKELEDVITSEQANSLCMDDNCDKAALACMLKTRFSAVLSSYRDKVEKEWELTLEDDTSDIDTGVLLGVMNLLNSLLEE